MTALRRSVHVEIRENGSRVGRACYNIEQNCWDLFNIDVEPLHRGEGYGSMLLQSVCAQADRKGAYMTLCVSGCGPISDPDLKRWYERYGFRGDGSFLTRRPKEKANDIEETDTRHRVDTPEPTRDNVKSSHVDDNF